MRHHLTPKQVARAIGVSEASLKRWCDKGLIQSVRTAGGHRRLPIHAVMTFLRSSGHALVRPELLGLPASSGAGTAVLERGIERLIAAFDFGDEERVRRIVFDLFLAGHSAVDICDRAIAPALHIVGEHWEHGRIEIFQERRAVEICMRVLYELRRALPLPAEDAPYAIGGALEGDPYIVPSVMVEVALSEAGWRAESYGVGHPAATCCSAIAKMKPRLFWVSVSHIASEAQFLADFRTIFDAAHANSAAFVVGGRALTDALRRQMDYSMFCDNLRHLVTFARTLYATGQSAQPAAC